MVGQFLVNFRHKNVNIGRQDNNITFPFLYFHAFSIISMVNELTASFANEYHEIEFAIELAYLYASNDSYPKVTEPVCGDIRFTVR